MASSFNSQKFNESTFNEDISAGRYVTSYSFLKWNGVSYSDIELKAKWNNKIYEEFLTDFLWHGLSITSEFSDIFQWINREYFFDESNIFQWNGISYLEQLTDFLWRVKFNFIDLRFDQEGYDESYFDSGTLTIPTRDIFKWINREFLSISGIVKWSETVFTGEDLFNINWQNMMFVSQDSIVKWNNGMYVPVIESILQWNGVSFTTTFSITQWNEISFVIPELIAQWNNVCYNTSQITFLWLGAAGVVWPLNDYLSVKTIQGKYIFPDIIGGSILFKDGSIGKADLEITKFIPEDSRCIFYLKGTARMFDGISRHCVKDGSSGTYKVTIQEYNEILKPENGKGGHYLVRNEWHDVELHNLVSSQKPTENDNELGLLYIAASAISDSLFTEYDTINNIFKFEYTGLPYTITEVFEDVDLLTPQTSVEFLKSTVLTTQLIVSGTETVVSVNSTTGFAASGSIYIDTEQITYTSKTATQFKGCVRGAGSTTKKLHIVGDVVRPKQIAACLLTTALVINGVETSLAVNNTTGFAASGAVFVGGEQINYASKTSTAFNGCVRGANGVSKKAKAVGAVVTHNTDVSGWYHDVDNKTLYIRCTDGTFPYYHVISVPYIWDFKVPIRIGNISSEVSHTSPITIYSGVSGSAKVPTAQPPTDGCYLRITGTGTAGDIIITGTATDSSTTETVASTDFNSSKIAISSKKWKTISKLNIATWTSVVVQSSAPVIAFWETANGDIPLDTLETLLTALNLEFEPVYRNGVCYIDISYKIGSGTTSSPANYYNEKDNIIAIQEIDMADARNMINGVSFTGYGAGAGGVKAGRHINMGRGGRFVLLDDSAVHSQAMADNFVVKYLEDHYLPARSLKFSAPLFVGGAVDQRRLGDTAHISIPSEYFEQDLRVKEIAIKLKPLSQTLTFGDRLISWDDQIKAMRAASEKYRKHLQDEIEEFSFNWTENLENKANRTKKFKIKDGILKIQKLELSCSTSLYKVDAMQGVGDGGGGGAGDGSSGEPAEKPRTGAGSPHTHTLTSGTVGVPSATVQISARGHTHTYSSTSGAPSATTSVVTGVTSVAITTTQTKACCTGINCGKEFVSNVVVTGGVGSVTSTNAASSAHTHSISGTTSGDDSYQSVATFDHTHTITALVLATEATHTHEISATGQNPTVATEANSEVMPDPTTGDISDDWLSCVQPLPAAVPYTAHYAAGSDPNMNFSVKISGPGIIGFQEITGSPFVVKVTDSFGPVLISNLVKTDGEYTVKVSLANNDMPTGKARVNFSIQINGQIFVDTIVKE